MIMTDSKENDEDDYWWKIERETSRRARLRRDKN
jgi:hypothetical protein